MTLPRCLLAPWTALGALTLLLTGAPRVQAQAEPDPAAATPDTARDESEPPPTSPRGPAEADADDSQASAPDSEAAEPDMEFGADLVGPPEFGDELLAPRDPLAEPASPPTPQTEPPPEPTPAPAPAPPDPLRTGMWVGLGIAAAGTASLLVSAPWAASEYRTLRRGCGATPTGCAGPELRRTRRLTLAADASLGVALGSLVTGLVLWSLQGSKELQPPVEAWLGPSQGGLLARHRF